MYSEFLVIFTRSFLSLWQFFGQVHKVNIRRCQFSGQVQIFWLNSIGHIESVKLTALKGIPIFGNCYIVHTKNIFKLQTFKIP